VEHEAWHRSPKQFKQPAGGLDTTEDGTRWSIPGWHMAEQSARPRAAPRLARRSIQLGLVATLVALLPLVLLARLTMARAQDAVRDEVSVRLRVTTAMSAALLAEQLAGFVTLAEAEAKHPRLARAAADPARSGADIERSLTALLASRDGLAATGLLDLDGVLLASPVAPELVGDDFSRRDYYRGLTAKGDTYVSEAFESAQSGHPLVVTIATYVRAPGGDGAAAGEPRAILLLTLQLDAVQPLADSVAAVQGVNLWVTDQRGKLLAAPGGRPPGLRAVTDEPIGDAAALAAGQVGDVEVGGEPNLVVHRTVAPLGWTVFAAVPHAKAYAGVDAVRGTMLAIAIPLGLIVCGGIVLLLRLQRRQWRVEAALAVARDQARDASRLKTEFLSRISHELRTPLNAILGFGQLLQLDDLTDEQREGVDQILRGGRHLLGLINEVLDISRIETGSLALSVEVVDLLEVVTETADLIRPLAAEREIQLHPPTAEECGWIVRADRQRLKQVLLNLASNAVKYNRHGGSIHVTCHPLGDDRVGIVVRDTGAGIPPDKMERLFMPFDRLGAEQTEVQGTGLGLALSQGLMEAMGGTLTAHSVEGEGTSFILELAVVDAPAGGDGEPVAPEPAPRQDAGAAHTILYVEDNPSNLRLVERVLARRGGVRLVTTAEGETVQALVREHRPDLVLLDLHLPGIDGEEVLRRLRLDPDTAGLPVVMVSAEVTDYHRERLLAVGANEYLTKPLDVPRFLAVVDGLLAVAHR
jgi:signal transduction histidine kinase/CheY-like chemotaxis protein